MTSAIHDWDDAYANAAYIPGGKDYPARWTAAAAAFRATARGTLDVPYGPGKRQRYDLFSPDGEPNGLFVFVHGGYWLDFDKSFWSHLARGAVARGWAAMLPSYDLCPDVSISTITRQVGAAIGHAAACVGMPATGPIVLSGHSAGGHLVARMMSEDAPLSGAVSGRIRRAVGISGLYDLRPLQKTAMNKDLKIDEALARSESPILTTPRAGAEFVAWVGAAERPEFVRQSKDFVADWAGKGARTSYAEEPERHHFNVIDGLGDPESGIIARMLAA